MNNLTEMLFEAATAVGDRGLPQAREMAAHCILDWLGVTLAACDDPMVEIMVADALENSGSGKWPVLGRKETVCLRDFVLVNGVAGHVLDYDDGMSAFLGHPSVPIVPALLAIAASRDCSGAELLDAMVTAVEMGGRLGLLLTSNLYSRGFHGTSVIGAVAAAAGCARLLKLDREQSLHAIGLAGTRASGLKASFGSGGKSLHAGWAALNAFTGACWAERGYTGSTDIVGDKSGMTAPLGFCDLDAALAAPEGGAHIMGVNYKNYSSCAATHPGIEMTKKVRAEQGLTADMVAAVTMTIPEHLDRVCNIQSPVSGLEAKFSLRATQTMVWLGINPSDPKNFDDGVVTAPDFLAMRDKIIISQYKEADTFGLGKMKLEVETTDGRKFTETPGTVDAGHSEAGRLAVRNKFHALAAEHIPGGNSQAMADLILGFANKGRARDILAMLREPVVA